MVTKKNVLLLMAFMLIFGISNNNATAAEEEVDEENEDLADTLAPEDEDDEDDDDEETQKETEEKSKSDEDEDEDDDEVRNLPSDVKKTLPVQNPNEQKKPRKVQFKTYHPEDISYRRKHWREIDLAIKPNQGYYYRDKELVKYIIEGVKNDQILPYKSYKKKERMTKAEFLEKLQLPISSSTAEEDDWDTEDEIQDEAASVNKLTEFLPRDISLLEIEEELIFHAKRSEWSELIRSVKLIIPRSRFESGLRRELGVFDYEELMTYLDSNEEALWRNDINASAHKKFSIAFKERIFSSILIKLDNPNDYSIADELKLDDPKEIIKAAQEKEKEIIALKDSIAIP